MKENKWLITNSQLYFANRILSSQSKTIDVYGLVDLSYLIQSIILADKLITLPGHNNHPLQRKLKEIGLLEIMDIDRTLEDFFWRIKGDFSETTFLGFIAKNKNEIISCLSETLLIDKKVVSKELDDIYKYTSHQFNSPSYEDYHRLLFNCKEVDLFIFGNYPIFYSFNRFIKEVYIGALFYFMIASDCNFNYSPDTVRLPLTALFADRINHEIFRGTQSILKTIDKKSQETQELLDLYTNSKFEIPIPSIVTWVLRSSQSKEEIIDKALELRNKKEIVQLREWIVKLMNFKSNKELQRMIEEVLETYQNKLETNRTDIINTSIPLTLDSSKLGLNLLNSSSSFSEIMELLKYIPKGIELAFSIIPSYLKQRNFTFFRKIDETFQELKSNNMEIKRLFGKSISELEDIELFNKVICYHDKYIKPLKDERFYK